MYESIKDWSLYLFYKAKVERCIIKKPIYVVFTSQERQMNNCIML